MRLFKRRSEPVEVVTEPEETAPEPTLPEPPAADADGRRSVADEKEYLLSLVTPLPAFGMYLLDAWGTAVCEDIITDNNLPDDDLVAVAGYAVRADDLAGAGAGEVRLQVRAGDKARKPGSAVRVRQGQPLPEGMDAVIADRDAELDDQALTVTHPVKLGEHVRWSGSEARAGVPIMRSGERLDARNSALLALAGVDRVLARPRPRVVVLSVAEEEGHTDVESPLLASALKSDGVQVWRVSNASGTDRELQDLISDQLIRADIVLVSGDLDDAGQLTRVVAAMGLMDVADVALEPGGRIGLALVGEDEIPLILLPDDPVASYVEYQFFVRPLIRKLMGAPVVNQPVTRCIAGGELRGREGTVSVRLGTVRTQEGEKVVVPLGSPDYPRLTDLVSADALVVLDETGPVISLGERVGCWLLDD
ncbi:gephyrin-like molybdotransferase Glp [Propionimicrobium sp. PCR01-08-3]|uniref:molybdopterin molybdotransferase MoeA n=1 Tax=Propionimicrobium sp. PCR01-08-3 TaxID=3052086 RepID=UPI00255CA86C|nr:gephyrin-like molybdotransferase Glp [Propionimicrobium sp. PCR01-08-3]WIY82885.1 hypothetical protein QQ658_00545 [Propionimicrobium sp. PCR01-08-3]